MFHAFCLGTTYPRLCGHSFQNPTEPLKAFGPCLQKADSGFGRRFLRRMHSWHSGFVFSGQQASFANLLHGCDAMSLHSASAELPAQSEGRAVRWRVRIGRQQREPRQSLRQDKSKFVISSITPRKDLLCGPGDEGLNVYRPLLFSVSTRDTPGQRKYNLRSSHSHKSGIVHKWLGYRLLVQES